MFVCEVLDATSLEFAGNDIRSAHFVAGFASGVFFLSSFIGCILNSSLGVENRLGVWQLKNYPVIPSMKHVFLF